MQELINALERLKESIDRGKQNIATLNGNREATLKRLKEEFGLNSLEDAEEWLIKQDEELAKEEKNIEALFAELKKSVEEKDEDLARSIFR